MTAADVERLVATPEFQWLFRVASTDTQSQAYRSLKVLERMARGTTKREERLASLRNKKTHMASVQRPRQSQKETDDGLSERISV